MAKKSTKSDRQAVIDEIRKKQKGAEKRRGYAIVGVCSLVALLIVVAAAYRPVKNWWDLRKFKDINLASIGARRRCATRSTTKPADGNQQHVPTGSQVTYSTAPPAFGSHWNEQGTAPAPFNRKFYTEKDRPELEALVHNLEHGYTILWYDESIADDADELNVIDGHRGQVPLRLRQPAATSSSPRRGPPRTRRRAASSPTGCTSRSRTGRPAAPARATPPSRSASSSTAASRAARP